MESLGVGSGLSIVTIYITELSPADQRGRNACMQELFIIIGSTLGYGVNIVFEKSDNGWRWMLGLAALLPSIALTLLASGLLPESPRFLNMHGRRSEAEEVLRRVVSAEEADKTMK